MDRPRQTPEGDEIFLDHVGWYVADMDEAGRVFPRLGFALTDYVAHANADPAGGPPVPSGTGNRCAMLGTGYIEILSAVPGADTALAEQLRFGLARHGGVHLIALTVDDAEVARDRLAAEGFAPQPVVHLRRPVELEDGKMGEVAFSVIRVGAEAMEEGRIQMLRQETPDLVWQDRFITRDNHITALTGVLLCVDEPEDVAARYGRFTGREASGAGDYCVIALDRGRFGFATPERVAKLLPGIEVPCTPFMAAIALASADVAATARFLNDNGVAVEEAGGMVHVGAGDALGAGLVIHRADAAWPPQTE